MFVPPWQIFCWPFKVTSTVLCIVDEAGLGTALIVGCMSAKQDATWITFILTRFASVWSECML